MANLMDAVQEALSSRHSSDVKRIVWLAAIDIVAANTETLLNLLFRNNEELVSSLITEKFQRMYLESTLLMDIPTINDPQIRPVLFEAGVFAGIEHQFTYRGRSSDHFSSLLSVFTSLLHVLSQAAILLKVLTSASNPLSWANLLFAFITFLPAFITLIERFVIVAPVYLGDFGMKTRQITQLGQMGPYKQEILLFGLADWVLQKWENVTFDSRQRRTEYRQNERISYTGVNIIRDSLHSMQYAFIAIGAFPATISLGSMRLCQNSASSLVSTLMMVQDRVRLFMDMVFQFEAFSQVMQMKDVKTSEKGVLRRYETTVVDGQKRGMRIEARNLSFTYPGQTEPALKNVNLTIEPGETLAIVGFNGGGKTTLVKVLMGLYNYSGSLTINDHEASTYDRPSLHAKTTVCFQDFSRYDDTVKENVGTGNFRRMDDLELLGTALKRGGADTVVDQLDDGIDQLLHQWGTPLDAEPGAGPNKKSGKTDKVKPPKTMGKGRGRFMRMHALARDVGTNLSGGQWQRLALARAFMRSDEADLVVFDEPSSSLDAVAEHELFERIHGLSKSETGQKIKTTIYVSHRFNTTRKADKIAVVENGTVTEVGSHDKLMALGGRYAEFFNLQAQAFL
ncbi:hypothetical protein FRC02_011107 [Tulasnella sp. 418]|nr:hypothetical protein FRC02_011107 [Tulasnella sp. 418]